MSDLPEVTQHPAPTFLDRLAGPHEWGYRDPCEAEFISDNTPFQAVDYIKHLEDTLRREGFVQICGYCELTCTPLWGKAGDECCELCGGPS